MRGSRPLSRRAAIGGGIAALTSLGATGPGRADASHPAPTVVALDWALAATAVALEADLVGVAEREAYRRWVGAPALPPEVAELGLRTAPNLEMLTALRPGLILINALNESERPRLETIAPCFSNVIYTPQHRPIERAIATTRALGALLDRANQAEAMLAHADTRFEAARRRLASTGRRRPILPVNFVDARHLRVYGAGSLFEDVARRVGLTPAWMRDTNPWGFATVGIEAMLDGVDCDILVIEPTPPAARASLDWPGLWTSLIAAGRNRVNSVPPVWAFGDMTAAARCADLLADALAPDGGAHAG